MKTSHTKGTVKHITYARKHSLITDYNIRTAHYQCKETQPHNGLQYTDSTLRMQGNTAS